MTDSLFRAEAREGRAGRLEGRILIKMPGSWQAIAGLLLIALICAVVFFSCVTFPKIEKLRGTVVLDEAISSIVPSRPGVIESVETDDGQKVKKGQLLISVRAEEDLRGNETLFDSSRRAILAQQALTKRHVELILQAAEDDQDRLTSQIEGMQSQIGALKDQIGDQRRLLENARDAYNDALKIAKEGFISKTDMDGRQTAVISRRQQLSQLEQTLSGKVADLQAALSSRRQLATLAAAQVAEDQSALESLKRDQAQNLSGAGYVIKAPIAGLVTALRVQPGQRVAADDRLLSILPVNSGAHFEFLASGEDVGQIDAGQPVRIAVDAFPPEQFGTISGVVTSVSQGPAVENSDNGKAQYLIRVGMDQASLPAFARHHELKSGMALTGYVTVGQIHFFGSLVHGRHS